MSSIAINVDNLGKKYNIGSAEKGFERLGDQVLHMVGAPLRRAGRLLRGHAASAAELNETIWALKDISFDVQHGEVVGIIGRNGAGKSTLLKILSRITDPSHGEATIYGRVGSLLEVGTGFHPELTGRENVFLNGAILGMKKNEIERRFDEIVAFAEIAKFIDTPVKHYSSGMYVRLAFSVAAHLDPEILVVDEVLAVGDLAFQRKCLGQMGDIARQGRTVLFVSHNMSLIQRLCARGIFLQNGQIAYDGDMDGAIDAYLASLEKMQTVDVAQRQDRKGQGRARLTNITIVGKRGIENGSGQLPQLPNGNLLRIGEAARINFSIDRRLPGAKITFTIVDHLSQPVAHFRSEPGGPHDAVAPPAKSPEKWQFACELDQLLLLPGRYHLNVSLIGDNRLQDYVEAAASFDVVDGHVAGRPAVRDKNERTRIFHPHRWIVPAEENGQTTATGVDNEPLKT